MQPRAPCVLSHPPGHWPLHPSPPDSTIYPGKKMRTRTPPPRSQFSVVSESGSGPICALLCSLRQGISPFGPYMMDSSPFRSQFQCPLLRGADTVVGCPDQQGNAGSAALGRAGPVGRHPANALLPGMPATKACLPSRSSSTPPPPQMLLPFISACTHTGAIPVSCHPNPLSSHLVLILCPASISGNCYFSSSASRH